ncbi:hypothetical protein Hanom_Chr02g00165801 [Helianthus anomalus]
MGQISKITKDVDISKKKKKKKKKPEYSFSTNGQNSQQLLTTNFYHLQQKFQFVLSWKFNNNHEDNNF